MDKDRLKSLIKPIIDYGASGLPDQTIIYWATLSIELIEQLEAENAKLKQNINKIKADAIRGAVTNTAGGTVYRRVSDLLEYDNKVEKGDIE